MIHGTGDVSLDPSYIPAFRSNGYDWAWSGLGGLFRHDDLLKQRPQFRIGNRDLRILQRLVGIRPTTGDKYQP